MGLLILNRDHKQSMKSVEEEFPNSHYLMRMDAIWDNDGYLLAVSPTPDSFDEFGMFLNSVGDKEFLVVGGLYGGVVNGHFVAAEQ